MNRRTTLIIAAILLLLATQRVAAYFDQEIGRRFEDNGDITTLSDECGRAWNILIGDGSDLVGKGANFAADCERAARTRALEAAGLVVLGGGVLMWAMWLAPKVRHTPLGDVVRKIPGGDIEVTGRPPTRGSDPGTGSIDQDPD